MIIESIIGGLLIFTPIDKNADDYKEQIQEVGQAKCLADNMYFEARNQGTAGIIAVSNVVLNRVISDTYPDTICGVIRQGPTRESWRTRQTDDPNDAVYHPIKHRCQFSWYCDGKPDKPGNIEQYNEMYRFALLIVKGEISLLDITDGAMWYHADYVNPSWASHKEMTTEIGDHIFYRSKDDARYKNVKKYKYE